MQIARDRERDLEGQITKLVGASAGNNRTLVALNELIRESESYRGLYQAFLQKFQELTQQQSSPMSEARVIAQALTPTSPSQPRVPLILGLALVAGLALGVGLGLLREYRDRTIRNGDQLRKDLDLDFLGIVPLERMGRRSSGPGLLKAVLAKPGSRFADTLRTVKVVVDSADAGAHPRIIGIVSGASREGKSTVAANLAVLLGNGGARTLLVDGDLRRCGLSSVLCPDAPHAFVEAVTDAIPLERIVVPLEMPNVDFAPSSRVKPVLDSSEILGSSAMKALLETGLDDYDYVVIDLPPMNALVDARAIAPAVTAFVFVAAWGETPVAVAMDALLQNPTVAEKCVGAVVNKVNLKVLRRYVQTPSISYGYSSY